MYVVTKYFGKILANNHLEGVKFHIPFQNLMQRGMLTHMGSRKSQAKIERARVRARRAIGHLILRYMLFSSNVKVSRFSYFINMK